MKERGVLFSGDEVRKTLDGKTQFRRPVKPQPTRPVNEWSHSAEDGEVVMYFGWPTRLVESRGKDKRDAGILTPQKLRCPFGVPGDRLWVKEKHVLLDRDGWIDTTRPRDELFPTQPYPGRNGVGYSDWEHDADSERCRRDYGYKWRPSIHMPRWASRLTLEVVAVRVERVQEISRNDAISEGCPDDFTDLRTAHDYAPRNWFSGVWEETYPGSWDRNDWVWVVEFRVLAELLRAEATQAAPAAEVRQ